MPPLTPADIEARLLETKRLITEKWGWFLALGIVLIIAGLVAIAFPLLSSITLLNGPEPSVPLKS